MYNILNTNLFDTCNLSDVEKILINERTYLVRKQKVMIDYDLAKLYGCSLKHLRAAVTKNIRKFPEEYRFQLNDEETNILYKFRGNIGRKENPYVFTEEGICMLSTVLNTEFAIKHSIYIMRSLAGLRRRVIVGL